MGYIPTSDPRVPRLQKEVFQLQEANNQLTAELHRTKAQMRSDTHGVSHEVESAEESLWHSQDKLKMERSYAKGFASVGIVSAPATVFMLWGIPAVEHPALITFFILFGIIFGGLALIGLGVAFAKVFGAIPEAKRRVEHDQRVLDRALVSSMGLT